VCVCSWKRCVAIVRGFRSPEAGWLGRGRIRTMHYMPTSAWNSAWVPCCCSTRDCKNWQTRWYSARVQDDEANSFGISPTAKQSAYSNMTESSIFTCRTVESFRVELIWNGSPADPMSYAAKFENCATCANGPSANAKAIVAMVLPALRMCKIRALVLLCAKS
jgi:hypothetical protein